MSKRADTRLTALRFHSETSGKTHMVTKTAVGGAGEEMLGRRRNENVKTGKAGDRQEGISNLT